MSPNKLFNATAPPPAGPRVNAGVGRLDGVGAMYQVKGFSETIDLMGYLVLALPDSFPPHQMERSIGPWFECLISGVNSVAKAASRPLHGVAVLDDVLTLCNKSREAFESGQEDDGRWLLQDAQNRFEALARAVRKGRGASVEIPTLVAVQPTVQPDGPASGGSAG